MKLIDDIKFAAYYATHMFNRLPSRVSQRQRDQRILQAGFKRGERAGVTKAMQYFPGASNGVLNADWSTGINSAIEMIRQDFSGLCGRSELAYRTSAIAKRAIDVLSYFVVGQGNRPYPTVRDANGESIDAINTILAADWERFNDQSIRNGTQDLTDYQAQQLDFRTIVTYGSALFNRVSSRKGALSPYAYQTLKPYRLDFSKDTLFGNYQDQLKKEQIIHGIAVNAYGEPLKFYFTDGNTYTPDNMQLCFYPIEAEQYLGLPWLTPVLPQIWDDQQLFDDKLKQSRIGARLGYKVSPRDIGGINNLLATDDDSGEQYLELDFQGFVGTNDKPEPISMTDPIKDTFKALVEMSMQRIAIGLGFSYQLFTSDLSGANFSSARMNTINDNLGFRTLYKWFVKARCQRRWEQFVYSEVLTGRLAGAGVTMAEYNRDPWIFNQCFHLPMDGQEWVDPLKDIQATVLAYKTGQITYQEICSRTGKHWQSVLKQLEVERKEMESRGLSMFLPENIDQKQPTEVTNENN